MIYMHNFIIIEMHGVFMDSRQLLIILNMNAEMHFD